MNNRLHILVPLMVVMLTGCTSFEKKVVGQWHQQSKSNNIFANMAVQGGPKAMLDITDDHRFTLSLDVARTDRKRRTATTTLGSKIQGTWQAKDKSLVFQTETSDGRPIADVVKEEAAADVAETPEQVDPNMPPEPSLDAAKAQFKADMDNLAKAFKPKTPVPASGKLSEGGGTITVTLEDGETMEFGKDGSA